MRDASSFLRIPELELLTIREYYSAVIVKLSIYGTE
jgi:hypothetical protein